MKTKIFNFNLVLLTALFMGLFMFNSCDKVADVDEKKIENKKISNLNSLITIPVDVLEVNGKTKVAFLLSAQWFDLNLPQNESVESIKMLKNAISEGTPLRFSYHDNESTEISKISSAGEEGKEYMKRFKTNAANEKRIETTKRLTNILPNEDAVYALCAQIADYQCPRGTNCIPFAYFADGCAARAHKMAQFINSFGYSCEKIFVYGVLTGRSQSGCCAQWSFHAAVKVKWWKTSAVTGRRIVNSSIIDPSIVYYPMSETFFKSMVTDPCGTPPSITRTAYTPSDVYYRPSNGRNLKFDNSDYEGTDCIINITRNLVGCGGFTIAQYNEFNRCSNTYFTSL